jgi:hypothetical protein
LGLANSLKNECFYVVSSSSLSPKVLVLNISTAPPKVKYQPFEAPLMNHLETLSLFTTQATLIGLTYFLPTMQVPYGYRLTLTLLLSTANISLVAYFIYHLLRIARQWSTGVDILKASQTFFKVPSCAHWQAVWPQLLCSVAPWMISARSHGGVFLSDWCCWQR